jgi:DNA invertase Pin-like site-specific DNA recombinase
MATKGYIRVSKIDQDTDKNKLDMIKFANDNKLGNVEFTEEHVTGRKHFRFRLLGRLLNEMQSGDILIIPEFSRLARSIIQIFEILSIVKQKGIILYSLKEHFSTNDEGITATVICTVFALIAQIERELISLRTKEALYVKRSMGIRLGRPKGKGKSKLDQYKDEILKLVELHVPKTIIAKRYGTSVINLYKYLKHYFNESKKVA